MQYNNPLLNTAIIFDHPQMEEFVYEVNINNQGITSVNCWDATEKFDFYCGLGSLKHRPSIINL